MDPDKSTNLDHGVGADADVTLTTMTLNDVTKTRDGRQVAGSCDVTADSSACRSEPALTDNSSSISRDTDDVIADSLSDDYSFPFVSKVCVSYALCLCNFLL